MRRLLFSTFLVVSLASPGVASAEKWKFDAVADLVAASMPSYVNIYNRRVYKNDSAASQPKGGDTTMAIEDDVGAGIVVSSDGLIVTNRHVIEGAYALFVTLSDGRRLRADLVLAGTKYDLAVIKVDFGDKPIKPAPLGDSQKMRVGDRVVAIGNPLGFASSVSAGVISAFHRQPGLSSYDDLIQTDATINRGNSGGPLFNMNGEVIGINQAIYTQNQGGSIGIGFSIPIDDVRQASLGMEKFGKPRIGWLGVSMQSITEPMAESLGLGANQGGGGIISSVSPNSPAAAAGLKVGDMLRTFNGKKLRDAIAVNRSVAGNADKTVDLGVWRDGKMIDVPVKLSQLPGNIWLTKMEPIPKMGKLTSFGGELADKPGLDGIEVTSVARKSIAWFGGLRTGDIIRKIGFTELHNIADLEREYEKLEKAKKPGGATIFVDGPNGARWLNIDLLQ
ncbi:MAG: trypsin-like peptidase domain-containing protein [Rhodoblastus sp.]